MFTLHFIQGYIQTIYLVAYSDKLLLLDGCSRADVATVCQFIETELNRPLSDLRLILVTHMHPDHAGGAALLRQKTGAKLAGANIAGDWYSGFDGIMMHLTDIWLAKWVAKRMGKPKRNLWYSRRLRIDVKLDDGNLLPGFDDWQVLLCQGHTDRDLALYCLSEHWVYVADLLVKVKGQCIAPYPLFYPNRYRQSLMKIKQLASKFLLLAHGGQVQVSAADFDDIITNAPIIPVTHWRSVKAKTTKVLGSLLAAAKA
ncbi:MAG: MBL fold metallo-hydrolase [Shewanella sp.]